MDGDWYDERPTLNDSSGWVLNPECRYLNCVLIYPSSLAQARHITTLRTDKISIIVVVVVIIIIIIIIVIVIVIVIVVVISTLRLRLRLLIL